MCGWGTVENRVVEVEGIGYPTKFALRKWVAVCDPCTILLFQIGEPALVGVKKTGRGRRKIGRKKRRMRARIRHRKK
jgi:hypothetical protein